MVFTTEIDNTMKSLETYINKARSAKSATPLVSRNELRSIVEQVEGSSVQTPPHVPHSLTQLQKGIIMASVLSAVAVGVWLWLSPVAPLNTAAQSGTTAGTKQTVTTVTKEKNTPTNVAPNTGIALTEKGAAPATPTIPATHVPILKLTPDEMKALGITQNNKELQVVIEEQFNEKDAPPQAKVMISKLGYPLDVTPLILRANTTLKPNNSTTDPLPYNPQWDVTKTKGFAPYVCAMYSSESEGSVSLSMSTTDHSPYVQSQDVARELRREFSQFMKDMSANDEQDIFVRKAVVLKKRDYKYIKYLVPVFVDMSDKEEKNVAVFYYLPTKRFLQALTPEHRKQYADLEPMLTENMIDIPYTGVSTVVEEEQIPVESSIAGIKHITLTAKELEAYGIKVQGTSIDFTMDDFTPTLTEPQTTDETEQRRYQRRAAMLQKQKKELQEKYGYTIDAPTVYIKNDVHGELGCKDKTETWKYTGWNYDSYSTISPVGYAMNDYQLTLDTRYGDYGKSRCINQKIAGSSPLLKGMDKEFTARMPDGTVVNTGSTIPVRVMLGTVNDAQPNSYLPKAGADSAHYHVLMIDLYFVPNRDFVERLPDRYRLQLMEELNMVERVIKGELLPEQACAQLHKTQSETMLDMCSIPQGTIRGLSIFPNPTAGDAATFSFTASEGGSYNISLYDVTGSLTNNLLQTTFSKGSNTITLPLKNVSPGVYILTVSSGKGVQGTLRIIKQ